MTPNGAFDALFAEGHRTLDLVMQDVTPERLGWQPPGTALPIGCVFAHAVGLEDLYVQQLIQGQPLLWDEEQWATRLGHALPPNQWNVNRILPPDMDALRAYQAAVFGRSRGYVSGLAADEFDRAVPFPGRDWSMTVAQLLSVTVSHTLGHAGEIAALRGVYGDKGLPF